MPYALWLDAELCGPKPSSAAARLRCDSPVAAANALRAVLLQYACVDVVTWDDVGNARLRERPHEDDVAYELYDVRARVLGGTWRVEESSPGAALTVESSCAMLWRARTIRVMVDAALGVSDRTLRAAVRVAGAAEELYDDVLEGLGCGESYGELVGAAQAMLRGRATRP
jgi:hypothetical protein